MRRTKTRLILLVFTSLSLASLAFSGCSKNDGEGAAEKSGKVAEGAGGVGAIDALPIGVESPGSFNYFYGKGEKSYTPVLDAYKKQDWALVKAACEAALREDAGHLDAHRLLATALSQKGDQKGALEHLRVALGGDWLRWGRDVETDPRLAALHESEHGAALKALNAAYRDQLRAAVESGLLVVGRRSTFKEPKVARGEQWISSRGELFAYVAETRRYVRLTHTDFRVTGFLRSPSGDELVWVAPHKVFYPKEIDAHPVLVVSTELGRIELATPDVKPEKVTFKSSYRTLALQYDEGDELWVSGYGLQGWWGLGYQNHYVMDKAGGELKWQNSPGQVPPSQGERLWVRYEGVELERSEVSGTQASWNERGAAATLKIAGARTEIKVPKGLLATRSSLALSPDKKKLVFATWSDPCEARATSSLYLVDTESGKLEHLATSAAAFHPRFVDDTHLAYEDDPKRARIIDVTTSQETTRLEARGGLSFVGLGAIPGAAMCKEERAVTGAFVEETLEDEGIHDEGLGTGEVDPSGGLE